MTMIAEG